MVNDKRTRGESSKSVRGKSKPVRGRGRGRQIPSRSPSPPPEEEAAPLNPPVLQTQDDPPRLTLDHHGLQCFVNDEALKEFNNRFRVRKALFEQPSLRSKVGDVFYNKIDSRGWGNLLTVGEEPINMTLVREFFANAKAQGAKTQSFFLRGQLLVFTNLTVAAHLSTPSVTFEDSYKKLVSDAAAQHVPPRDVLEMIREDICPGCPWISSDNDPRSGVSTVDWDDDLRIIVKFISSRLHPSSKFSEINTRVLKLVYAFVHDLPVDPAVEIHSKLSNFLENVRPNLIFPRLITEMARAKGIPELPSDILVAPKLHSLIRHSNLARRRVPPQQGPQAPPPRQSGRSGFSDQFLAVFQSLDQIRGWMDNTRQFHFSREPIYDYLASQAGISTETFFRTPAQPYEFNPFVQTFISGSSGGVEGSQFPRHWEVDIPREGGEAGDTAGTSRSQESVDAQLRDTLGFRAEDFVDFSPSAQQPHGDTFMDDADDDE